MKNNNLSNLQREADVNSLYSGQAFKSEPIRVKENNSKEELDSNQFMGENSKLGQTPKQKLSELSLADLFAFRTYFTGIYDDRKKAVAIVKEIRKRIDNIDWDN